MKKFTFKGVLDGFRQSVQPQATRQEQEIQEQLKADHFTLKKVSIAIIILRFGLSFLYIYM